MPFSKAHALAALMPSSPISAREFVEGRRTSGGPAPEETARVLAESRELLTHDRAWLAEAGRKIDDADALRRQRAAAL
jgi:hypothetical protein